MSFKVLITDSSHCVNISRGTTATKRALVLGCMDFVTDCILSLPFIRTQTLHWAPVDT